MIIAYILIGITIILIIGAMLFGAALADYFSYHPYNERRKTHD